MLTRYGDFEAGTDPGVISMKNSRYYFGGNLGISSGNTSLNAMRTGKSSMCCSLSASASSVFTANSLQPFLIHFFACKADIFLKKTFLGMP